MKNNSKNLDEIFGKARNLQPEISRDEIHALFSDEKLIKNYQKKKIIGTKFMYFIAGAISIATIVGGLIFSTPTVPETTNFTKNKIDTNIPDENINKTLTKKDFRTESLPSNKKNDVKANKNTKDDFAVNTQKSVKKILPENEITPKQSSETIQIDGLKVIELNQQQLDNLGISIDKEGKFIEVYMYLEKNIPMKHKIFVDWGVGFDEKDKNSLPKNSKIIIPNFISDNSGNRRIQIFNDDDNKVMITDTHREFFVNDKSLNIDISKLRDPKNVYEDFGIDSILTQGGIIDADGKLTINKDQIVVMEMNDTNSTFVFNDGINNVNITSDIIVNKICMSSDSSFSATSLADAVNKTLDKVNIKIEMFNQKIVNKLIPLSVPVPNATDRNGKPLKNFKFILWFEPTDDFISALPEEMCSDIDKELELLKQNGESCSDAPITGKDTYLGVWQGCSGAIENLRVYPNPTDGPIAIDCMLKEKRNLSISLHDLTGRKIKDLGNSINAGAGEFNTKYELTKIEPGVYLVVVQSEIGERAVQRVIVGK